MISKNELNKAIDNGVLKLCVDTLKNPEWQTWFPNQVETCEKILRTQFCFDDKAIAELRK